MHLESHESSVIHSPFGDKVESRLVSAENHQYFLKAVFWILAGMFLACCFQVQVLLPVWLTIAISAAVTILSLTCMRVSRLSLLPRFYVLLYVMPFTSTLGYLFDDQYVFWQSPSATPLASDLRIINTMVTIGLVGLCGLLAGIELSAMFCKRPSVLRKHKKKKGLDKTLSVVQFTVLLVSALVLSWLSAPSHTVFTAAYASAAAGSTLARQANFNSAFLVSYILLILLYLDAERSQNAGQRKSWKTVAVYAALLWIIVVLQVLRGNRDSSGLIVALAILIITKPSFSLNWFRERIQQNKMIVRTALVLAGIAIVYVGMGSWRYRAADSGGWNFAEVRETFLHGLQMNTWSSVGLNNLGLAAEYDAGTIEYHYGKTYVDYFLSLPPGLISRIIGYVRPLEHSSGPNWWYTGLSTGGMQPAIVPFKNFGIMGTLCVLILYGFYIGRCECRAIGHNFYARLSYGATAVAGFLWFWYGDMNIIRTVMITFLLTMAYRLCIDNAPHIKDRLHSIRKPNSTLSSRYGNDRLKSDVKSITGKQVA
jgi:hypothetical protein